MIDVESVLPYNSVDIQQPSGVIYVQKNTLSLDEYNSLTLNMGDLTESECRLNEYINKHFNELPIMALLISRRMRW